MMLRSRRLTIVVGPSAAGAIPLLAAARCTKVSLLSGPHTQAALVRRRRSTEERCRPSPHSTQPTHARNPQYVDQQGGLYMKMLLYVLTSSANALLESTL